MRRAVVVACAAVVALAATVATGSDAAPGATPRRDGVLLRRFAPTLVLHPQERFGPVPVEGFLRDSDLQVRDAAGAWVPSGGDIATAPPGSRLDQRLCRAVDGPSAIPCYAAAEDAHGASATAYGVVFRTGARIALQYWLFYPFDAWSPTLPAGDFWKAHEGDWESVTVILDRSERPLVVGVSRHCGGVRRAWGAVRKRDGRPLVWVGLGAHAHAFGPGTFVEQRRCWPDVALAVFDAYRVELVDRAATGLSVTPRVVRVTAGAPSWMRFPGAWGEDQYAGFPSVAPFRYGAGPEGPAFHAQWERPLGTPLSWPAG